MSLTKEERIKKMQDSIRRLENKLQGERLDLERVKQGLEPEPMALYGKKTSSQKPTGPTLESLKRAQEEGRQRGQQERKRQEQSGGIQEPGIATGRKAPEQPVSGSLIRGSV